MNHMINRPKDHESYLLEFLRVVAPYRWSILAITLLSVLFTATYLYFTPPIYESSAIVKIKPDNQNIHRITGQDPLSSALSVSGNADVEQELAILNTFYTNNKAIDKLNMAVQYFVKHDYRKVEIFSNPPIKIKNVTIYNNEIIGKQLILHPKQNGFKIQKENIMGQQIFAYNQEVQTKDFKCVVEKQSNFNQPIHFQLNGNNRNIYEKIVKEKLKVSRLNEDVSIIKVAYQDTSAKRADDYVNALINIYIDQSITDKSKKNNKILDFIEQQLTITGKKLKLSETQLEEYRINNNVIQPTAQSGLLLDRLNNIEIELSENKIKERLAENLMVFVKNNKHLDSIVPTLRELGEEPTIMLIQTIQDLQRRANELSAEFTEKHPDLISLRNQIRRNQRTIYLNVKNLKSAISNRQQDLTQLKTKNESNLKHLPEKEKQLIQYQRNYDVNSKMYSYLLEKKSENEMKKVATISDYEIIDHAYSNPKPIKPKKMMLLAMAFIIGLLTGMIIAYIRNALINKIQDSKEIKHLTSLPIYGELPLLAKPNAGLEVFNNPQSPLTTSFRNLRTTLQFMTNKSKGNTILVTSSISNEGKSTITSNLSTIFQMAGYKSIILDLDLYQPTLHKFFNIEHAIGMSTYLNRKDSIGDIIFSTAYQNLDIIPAGPVAPNASELILSERFNSLLSTLQKRYDYIFIDSAPFTMVADTLYLMQFSDVNLIVVRENFTQKSFLSNLDEVVAQREFKNTGLLVNTSQTDSNPYGYEK
ncbi:MAG: polysaccharide biosynthesis tyrosine autokinase [Epsilonproteobacteria bacterium]|nr:polysaccharide biosynthesis tyrosine autokinase [Campylobacterota bacterium]